MTVCVCGRPRAPLNRRPSCIHRGPGTRALAVETRSRVAAAAAAATVTAAAARRYQVMTASDDASPRYYRVVIIATLLPLHTLFANANTTNPHNGCK